MAHFLRCPRTALPAQFITLLRRMPACPGPHCVAAIVDALLYGLHLGTWASEKGYCNVAANYCALQRLRNKVGTATLLSDCKAYDMLKCLSGTRRDHTCESPWVNDTQSSIDDDEFNQEQKLINAKKSSKAYNRRMRGAKAGKNWESEEQS